MIDNKNYFVEIGYPAREKNFVLPLINGEEAWQMVYNHLLKAKKSIHLCFWALENDFELVRNKNEILAGPSQREKNTLGSICNSGIPF